MVRKCHHGHSARWQLQLSCICNIASITKRVKPCAIIGGLDSKSSRVADRTECEENSGESSNAPSSRQAASGCVYNCHHCSHFYISLRSRQRCSKDNVWRVYLLHSYRRTNDRLVRLSPKMTRVSDGRSIRHACMEWIFSWLQSKDSVK